jgi:hypothetical protein
MIAQQNKSFSTLPFARTMHSLTPHPLTPSPFRSANGKATVKVWVGAANCPAATTPLTWTDADLAPSSSTRGQCVHPDGSVAFGLEMVSNTCSDDNTVTQLNLYGSATCTTGGPMTYYIYKADGACFPANSMLSFRTTSCASDAAINVHYGTSNCAASDSLITVAATATHGGGCSVIFPAGSNPLYTAGLGITMDTVCAPPKPASGATGTAVLASAAAAVAVAAAVAGAVVRA